MNPARTMLLLIAFCLIAAVVAVTGGTSPEVPEDRREVVFWHFWGGADRRVVEDVVARFNASQSEFHVRAVAMPGNNLDLKLFLAVTGGEPPDLINQDDPIVADWAHRDALMPLDQLLSSEESAELHRWLLPAALRLGQYEGRLYGLCNGLDIRALYFNRTLLEQHGLQPPRTTSELDEIAEKLSLRSADGDYQRFGYLPDPRRLWAWGVVFGGDFYDEGTGQVTAHDPAIVKALDWMAGYRRKFGAGQVAAFRQGDQSLPGSAFPLLPLGDDTPHGRYAVIMDGQWRVREIDALRRARQAAGKPLAQYGVCPLPPPVEGGRLQAGWVNGNFFLIPRNAANPLGAWQFMKFWIGFGGYESQAAHTCMQGGWIPVSQAVVRQAAFQQYLRQRPLFAEFVKLAASENQLPIPVIPGAGFFNREIRNAGSRAMYDPQAPPAAELLEHTSQRIQQHLDRIDERR